MGCLCFFWHRPIKNSHFTWFLYLDPNWRTYVLQFCIGKHSISSKNTSTSPSDVHFFWGGDEFTFIGDDDVWVFMCLVTTRRCMCCCHFRTDGRKRSYPGNISLRVFVSRICVTPLLDHQKEKVTLKSKSHSPSSRASLSGVGCKKSFFRVSQ